METTVEFSVNEIGSDTGNPYVGKFKVKTILTRKDRFAADERRRMLLGASAGEALLPLQEEAFVLGQLYVRVVDGPKWWNDSDFGANLEDGNVIARLYELAVGKEKERRDQIRKEAEKAVKKIASKE